MKNIFVHITRIYLGIIFLGAGINGFIVVLGFDPIMPTSEQAMALFQFDYLLIAEKSLEIVCGILLLLNLFVPLTLAVLTPLIVNIFLLHVFVDPSLLLLAITLVIALIFLLYIYRKNYLKLFEIKPQ